MGLHITRLMVDGFRSYNHFELEPDPCLTLIVGPNAVGKTNLIEAIQLLSAAESFRRPNFGDLVKRGEPQARLSLVAQGKGRTLQIELAVSREGRREYRINGKPRRRIVDVAGVLPCVVFAPDDLRLVKDSAERRRAALDSLGSQLSPSYAQLKAEYERVLRQRNAVLRAEKSSPEELDPWTAQLVALGSRFVGARSRLFERLKEAMTSAYDQVAEDGPLEPVYRPSWERDGVALAADDPEEAMTAHLTAKRGEELARRTTLTGPHRDEIEFTLSGADARALASQGQQRTIALAWKIGEVSVVTQVSGQAPVLLLDDVMSELDERRRHALASYVGNAAQTIMTTANIGYFEPSLVARSQVVELG